MYYQKLYYTEILRDPMISLFLIKYPNTLYFEGKIISKSLGEYMSSISAIFFDLDGTLVDSSIGIHNGFTYTFEQLGVTSPDAKTIRGFMGPPLETSFASCLPAEQIEEAIQLYRYSQWLHLYF